MVAYLQSFMLRDSGGRTTVMLLTFMSSTQAFNHTEEEHISLRHKLYRKAISVYLQGLTKSILSHAETQGYAEMEDMSA